MSAFVWVADPQISPDGSRIAFVRVTADRAGGFEHATAIWTVATDGRDAPRQLTTGVRDSSPRWSPDGVHLTFLRAVENDGRPRPPQIYVMPMTGGEPRAITDIPRGAANPVWSPDGTTIAFTSAARPDELPDTAAGKAVSSSKPRQSDVRVITEAVYRANGVAGSGYVESDRPAQVWTVALAENAAAPVAPRRLTSGAFAASNPQWSADGSEILFVSDRRRENYYHPRDTDLYAVAKTGGEPRRVASIDGVIGEDAASHDGRRLAFIGTPHGTAERSYNQPDLWVMDLPSGTPRNLTASYDFDIGGALSGDQRSPRGQHPAPPIWSEDDRVVFVRSGRQGTAPLIAIDPANGRTDLYSGHREEVPHEVVSYTADRRAARFAIVRSTPTTVGDLCLLDGPSGSAPKKLTAFNDSLFTQLALNEPEENVELSFDGRKIQGGS